MTNEEYGQIVSQKAKKSPLVRDCLNAFWIGGLICVLGQLLMNWFGSMGLGDKEAGTAVSMSLVVLSALLTGFSIYDDIAKVAGAGTLVPITGFANSMVSPAMEFKSEGFITGLGSKLFTVAGPVLVFGITASVVYGLIIFIFQI